MIFDSHAHYDDQAFDPDREKLLRELPQKGVCGVINAASNLQSAEKGIQIAEAYQYIYAAVGIHPLDVETVPKGELPQAIQQLKKLITHPKVVAIGEIGLDYHYDTPRNLQMQLIRAQLAFAKENKLPVILHDREAHGAIMELLREFRPTGVIHCFSGSVEMAKEVLNLGLSIGLGGAVTFKNAVHPLEVAKIVPEDRLLLETDAPYMAPVPFRGQRCDSSLIAYTAEKIAQVRNEKVELLLQKTAQNARNLFHI